MIVLFLHGFSVCVKTSVPFGVAPSTALRASSQARRTVDRAGEIFVTCRSRRQLPPSSMELNNAFAWVREYVNMPCKSYLTLRVRNMDRVGATGLRVTCEAKDQVSYATCAYSSIRCVCDHYTGTICKIDMALHIV